MQQSVSASRKVLRTLESHLWAINSCLHGIVYGCRRVSGFHWCHGARGKAGIVPGVRGRQRLPDQIPREAKRRQDKPASRWGFQNNGTRIPSSEWIFVGGYLDYNHFDHQELVTIPAYVHLANELLHVSSEWPLQYGCFGREIGRGWKVEKRNMYSIFVSCALKYCASCWCETWRCHNYSASSRSTLHTSADWHVTVRHNVIKQLCWWL